jgi:hypothetical protein
MDFSPLASIDLSFPVLLTSQKLNQLLFLALLTNLENQTMDEMGFQKLFDWNLSQGLFDWMVSQKL